MFRTGMCIMSQWSEMLGLPYGRKAANRKLQQKISSFKNLDQVTINSRIIAWREIASVCQLAKPPVLSIPSWNSHHRKRDCLIFVHAARVVIPKGVGISHGSRRANVAGFPNNGRIIPMDLSPERGVYLKI